MSLFTELKRRNVFKVAIAYLMVSWLILQLVDVMTPILILPDWFARVAFMALAIFFPIMLLFTWAFELSPEGLKKTADIEEEQSTLKTTGQQINYTIITVLVLVIGLQFWMSRDEGPVDEIANTIAVMPFADMSADGSQEYFGDGIAEEILNVLVSVDELDVTSRTSSFAYKNKDLRIPVIASELGVNYIVEGSIRSAGNRVRVTAQLIDVAADSHMWSETYDRDLTDIFAIQDEISGAIAEALKINLIVGGNVPTNNIDAYQLYLKGHYNFLNRGRESLSEAIDLLEQAVELDANFAEAWADLAASRSLSSGYGVKSDNNTMEKALTEAERALALNPELAQAWVAMSNILFEKNDLQGSLNAIKRAATLDPKNETAWLWTADTISFGGQFEEATEFFERAIEIAPTVPINYELYAASLLALGNISRAKEFAYKAAELGRIDGNFVLSSIMLLEGEKEKFIDVLTERMVAYNLPPYENPESFYDAYYDPSLRDGLKAFSRKRLEDEIIGSELPLLLMLDGEGMVTYLENSSVGLKSDIRVLYYPPFRPMLNQKAIKDYLRRIGLIDHWQTAGYPYFCQPVGEDDYICE